MTFALEVKDRSYAKLSNVLRSCYAVLALKDHTTAALREKQITKGYAEDLVDEAIEQLVKDNYVNDKLFAGGYFNSRLNKGLGPIRIRRDMKLKLVPEEYIEQVFLENEGIWTEKAI